VACLLVAGSEARSCRLAGLLAGPPTPQPWLEEKSTPSKIESAQTKIPLEGRGSTSRNDMGFVGSVAAVVVATAVFKAGTAIAGIPGLPLRGLTIFGSP